MIRNYGYLLASMGKLLGEFDQLARHQFQVQDDGNFRDFDLELAGSFIQVLKSSLFGMREMRMDLSLMYAERLIKAWEGFGFKRVVDEDMIRILSGRVEDELKTRVFMYVPSDKAALYNSPQLFGADVDRKFHVAASDIEEAGKCLALGRGTATVFHLMRVMEVGLKTIANNLGIPYAPSWEGYINQINIRIGQKHKTKGVKWKRDEPFYREVAGDLETIKIVWRNPTMHIVRRYTPEEATEVFSAVRAFMQRLASAIVLENKEY